MPELPIGIPGARFYSMAAPLDPAYRVLGALGRAGCVKARLTR